MMLEAENTRPSDGQGERRREGCVQARPLLRALSPGTPDRSYQPRSKDDDLERQQAAELDAKRAPLAK